VPVYAVFTNDQLAEMIKQEVRDVSALKKIQGVGDAKIEKFSGAILALLKASPPEKES
jgi:superfamily II DNA helicase RecQ